MNSGTYGITTYENYNIIIGNVIQGFGNSGINMGANYSIISSNIFFRENGTPEDYSDSQYPLYIRGDYNIVTGNQLLGKDANNTGTGNLLTNNNT